MGEVVSLDQVLLVIQAKASLAMRQVTVEGALQVGLFPNRPAAESFVESVKRAIEESAEPPMAEKRAAVGSHPIPELAEMMGRPYNETVYLAHSIMEIPRSIGIVQVPRITEETGTAAGFVERIPELLADLLLEHLE